jgi:hypothetical protein
MFAFRLMSKIQREKVSRFIKSKVCVLYMLSDKNNSLIMNENELSRRWKYAHEMLN